MDGPLGTGSRSDHEARRALLEDALADLAAAPDPRAAATEVMRALDAYVADHSAALSGPREPPVTDFATPRRAPDARVALWVVLGGAVVCTVIVAVLLSGGWPAGLAIAAIWVVALAVLLST